MLLTDDGDFSPARAGKTVLAMAGSLRVGSYNRWLLEESVRCAPPGLCIRLNDELGAIPLFSEDLERDFTNGSPCVSALRREVLAADGLLIATPEYNQSFPGVLKNAIDWLSRPLPDPALAGKPVALVGASTGPWGTRIAQSHLRHVLSATESAVMPQPGLFAKNAAGLFDDAGRLTDDATHKSLETLLTAFDQWIDRVAVRTDTTA